MNFRDNLRFLMDSKDIQIKELSARTGISENTIKAYLKADSAEPKVGNAVRIARALGVSVEFLATGTAYAEPAAPAASSATVERLRREVRGLSERDCKVLLAAIRAMRLG